MLLLLRDSLSHLNLVLFLVEKKRKVWYILCGKLGQLNGGINYPLKRMLVVSLKNSIEQKNMTILNYLELKIDAVSKLQFLGIAQMLFFLLL